MASHDGYSKDNQFVLWFLKKMYLSSSDIVTYHARKIIWYNLWSRPSFDWIALSTNRKVKERIFFILLETWEFSACAKWNTFPHGSIYFIHNYRLRIISGVCAGSWNLSKISLYHYLVIYGIMLWWSYDTNAKRNTWHDTGIRERKFSNSSHKKIYFDWDRGEALERKYLRERRK